jgi:hypothetical protein
MAATPLELLKFNLQERTYPYFQDDELQMLLDSNDNRLSKASYKGCLLKAEAADKMEISGIKLNSNREYWLTLAQQYLSDVKAEDLLANAEKNVYITSRQRSDGC